ncbi:MAG: HD domain-containing protein [Rickettsiales bacterium]|jgi:uncharacterized protein|nr:HD domain-containing protein [Rickettsiales bacterium]
MLETAGREAEKLLGRDRSGHGMDHTLRVRDLAVRIAREEGADPDTVALAALLHDADDYKLFGMENAETLSNAKAIMDAAGTESAMREAVLGIISTMGYGNSLAGIRPESIEGKCVSDADMIDGMGATGIIRMIEFNATRRGGHYFDRNIFPKLDKTKDEYRQLDAPDSNFVNHFFEKALRIKNILMTRSGRLLAEGRHKIMADFLLQFFAEQDAPEWTAYLKDFLASDENGS